MQLQNRFLLCFLVFLCVCCLIGCGKNDYVTDKIEATTNLINKENKQTLVPIASGEVVYDNGIINLDASNVSDGYVMLRYIGTNEKVKLQMIIPDGTEYIYPVTASQDYVVYPLPDGSGRYKVKVLESISEKEENLYATVFAKDLDVEIENEFSTFLYPNLYVNFTPDSDCVEKSRELSEGCTSDLEVITNIYDFIIKNIKYDHEKAESVSYGYIPDPDNVLK